MVHFTVLILLSALLLSPKVLSQFNSSGVFNTTDVSNSSNSTNSTSSPDPCFVNEIFADGYNSSSSISYPGPRVNDSYPESTWTWTRYITHSYNQSSNRTAVWEAVDLKTTPPLNLTNPNTLPYTGCYMTLLASDDNKRHAEDDGTCKNVLSKDCLEELIEHVNMTAQSVTGSYMGNSTHFDCTDLTRGLIKDKKSKCWRQWGATGSKHFLPDSSLTANATSQDDTSCPSIGHSDPLARTHYTSVSRDDGGPDNFTSYDRELRNPLPLVIATWLKEDNSSAIIWNQGYNFAGTQVVCIPANITTPGSRNITEALKSGSVPRATRLSPVLIGALSFLVLGIIM